MKDIFCAHLVRHTYTNDLWQVTTMPSLASSEVCKKSQSRFDKQKQFLFFAFLFSLLSVPYLCTVVGLCCVRTEHTSLWMKCRLVEEALVASGMPLTISPSYWRLCILLSSLCPQTGHTSFGTFHIPQTW